MSTEPEELALVVDDPADAGERADVVVGRRLPGVSRRVARALALEGKLLLDGRRCPPSTRVPLGARLSLRVARPEAPAPVAVLACTERFVYVCKPAGTHTHRLRPDDPPTLADAVALAHPECSHASPEPRQGGAAHRLDRDTSGVVAFARTLEAWRLARAAFRERRVLKLYRARVVPCPEPWPPPHTTPAEEAPPAGPWPLPRDPGVVIAARLGPAGRHRVAVREDGRAAITLVWRLPRAASDPSAASSPAGPEAALERAPTEESELLLRLVTGHRHQARVHLSWIGRPIVGDVAYGGPASASMRLHAAVLDLSDACPGEPRVHAPVPPDWSAHDDAARVDPPDVDHA